MYAASPVAHVAMAPTESECITLPAVDGKRSLRGKDMRLRCDEPGCKYPDTFRRRYELERHRKSRHRRPPAVGHADFYRCMQEACSGKKPMSRRDHFRKHLVKHHPQLDLQEQIHKCATTNPDGFPAAQRRAAEGEECPKKALVNQDPALERHAQRSASDKLPFSCCEGRRAADVSKNEAAEKISAPGRIRGTPQRLNLIDPALGLNSSELSHISSVSPRPQASKAKQAFRRGPDDVPDQSSFLPLELSSLPYRLPFDAQFLDKESDSVRQEEKNSVAQSCIRFRPERSGRALSINANFNNVLLRKANSAPPSVVSGDAAPNRPCGPVEAPDGGWNSAGYPNGIGQSFSGGLQSSYQNNGLIPNVNGQFWLVHSSNPSVSSAGHPTPVNTSNKSGGRFPCPAHLRPRADVAPAPSPHCATRQHFVSELLPHLQRADHPFFPCLHCFEVFETGQQQKFHRRNRLRECKVRCVTEWCPNYNQLESDEREKCMHGGSKQEDKYIALYRLFWKDETVRVPGISPSQRPYHANRTQPMPRLGPHAPNTPTADLQSLFIAGSSSAVELAEQPSDLAGHYSADPSVGPANPAQDAFVPYDEVNTSSQMPPDRTYSLQHLITLMYQDFNRPFPQWSENTRCCFQRLQTQAQPNGPNVIEDILSRQDAALEFVDVLRRLLDHNGHVDTETRARFEAMEPEFRHLISPPTQVAHDHEQITDGRSPANAQPWLTYDPTILMDPADSSMTMPAAAGTYMRGLFHATPATVATSTDSGYPREHTFHSDIGNSACWSSFGVYATLANDPTLMSAPGPSTSIYPGSVPLFLAHPAESLSADRGTTTYAPNLPEGFEQHLDPWCQ